MLDLLIPASIPELGAGPVGWIAFGVTVISTLLGALFGSLFGGADMNAINKALNDLRNQMAQAIDVVARFAWSVAIPLGALLSLLKDLFIGFFDGLYSLVKRIYSKLWKIATGALPQILGSLKKDRALIQWLYRDVILRMLYWMHLQRPYQYLLRLVMLKMGYRLDQLFGDIQKRIIEPYLYNLRLYNIHSQWLDYLLNYRLTLQRPLMLNTLYEQQADWIRIFWNAQTGVAAVDGGQNGSGGTPGPTFPEMVAAVNAWQAHGTGDEAGNLNQMLAELAQDEASV